jgi:putative endonuclease
VTFFRKQQGSLGETLATQFLQKKGMKFLEKNYRCKLGEMDLIFRDHDVLVFVEVKLRESDSFGPAALAVTPKKRKKIIQVAQYYLLEKKLNTSQLSIRFDIVGITKKNETWDCQHYRNAFLTR